MARIIFLLGLGLLLNACKTNTLEANKLQTAEQFFKALDTSNGKKINALIGDTLVNFIPEYNYKQVYSNNEYVNDWLKWDAVFNPTYKIIDIELQNNTVTATVSKIDKRIHFLIQKPFLTKYTIRFQNNKIVAFETADLNFDEKAWNKKKTALITWVNKNHPELENFINDQTEAGGIKYLRAIELYNQKE